MKTLFAIAAVSIVLLMSGKGFAQVSITSDGSAPHLSAMLDIKSTSRGLLIPRMDNTEMSSISSPAAGLMVFNTTKSNFFYYTGSAWDSIVGSCDFDWIKSGNNMYSGISGMIGIGTSSPSEKLHVYNGEVKVETNPGQNSIDLSQGTVVVNEGTSGTPRFVTAIANTWTWGMGKTNSGNNNFHLIYYPTGRWDMTVLTSNGNVGIGNTSPAQKLDINGNMKLAGAFYDVNNQPGTADQVLSSTGSTTDWIDLPPDNDWVVASNNMYSAVSGMVGIGTSSPTEKLHVYNGEVKVETNPGQNSIDLSQGTVVVNEGTSGTPRFVTAIANTWTWGMGKTNSGNNNFHLIYYPTGRWDMTVLTSNGNVGIGNTSPSQKLDINGNMKLAGAFYDGYNQPGSSGEILSSTGTATEWISASDFLDNAGYATTGYIRCETGSIEAFGNASITGGAARVSLAGLFSSDADLHQTYYVFLTPLTEVPVQMTVAGKNAESFTVKAYDQDGNATDCEFDYRVVARLKE